MSMKGAVGGMDGQIYPSLIKCTSIIIDWYFTTSKYWLNSWFIKEYLRGEKGVYWLQGWGATPHNKIYCNRINQWEKGCPHIFACAHPTFCCAASNILLYQQLEDTAHYAGLRLALAKSFGFFCPSGKKRADYNVVAHFRPFMVFSSNLGNF